MSGIARLAFWMPGKVATLATCSGPWSFLICSMSVIVGEDQAVDPHVLAVALGDLPLARPDLLQRPGVSSGVAHFLLPGRQPGRNDPLAVSLHLNPTRRGGQGFAMGKIDRGSFD